MLDLAAVAIGAALGFAAEAAWCLRYVIAKTIAEMTGQQDGAIRQQVIEQLMRQTMHYALRCRISPRRGDLHKSAPARSTDAGSDGVEHGDQSDPRVCWTGRGSFRRARDPFQKYRRPKNGGLTSPNGLKFGTGPPPRAFCCRRINTTPTMPCLAALLRAELGEPSAQPPTADDVCRALKQSAAENALPSSFCLAEGPLRCAGRSARGGAAGIEHPHA